jgi:uncharacterized SAM-binding protein YcdF (DUF218 family)
MVIVLLTGIALSPRYLVYADLPAKCDIIVLFAGSDRDSRLREAQQLLQEGYSDYLFIPVTFSLYKAGPGRGGITAIRFSAAVKPGIHLPAPRSEQEMTHVYFRKNWAAYRLPRYYEATHVEMLMAKKAMDASGFRKAIFVSSPYHMRRIKIMAARVFDPSYDVKLVPSRFEKKFEAPLPSQKDVQHVMTEFPKMIWFLCYDPWDRWIGVNQ